MSLINPYKILGLPVGSSIEDVKKKYKSIVLKSHPDKLNNITDINERNIKIKEFIDTTNAYNKILKGDVEDFNYDFDDNFDYDNYKFTYEDWQETMNSIKQSELFKNVVSMIMNFKSKSTKHNINVDINYNDYFSNSKKKLRLFLKKIDEPVYINLDCKKYPNCTINYFDNNDNEHEINITMNLINDKIINNGFYHLDDNDDNVNYHLYYDMSIDTIDYLTGNSKELLFINKEILKIDIPPFTKEIIINNYGINNSNLIIKLIYNPIEKEKWNILSDDNKNILISILNKLKMI